MPGMGGTNYKSGRLLYVPAGTNLVGLTNGSYYFFEPGNTSGLGTVIAPALYTGNPFASLATPTWATFDAVPQPHYLIGNGRFLCPDTATNLVISLGVSAALTGSSVVSLVLWALFDPPDNSVNRYALQTDTAGAFSALGAITGAQQQTWTVPLRPVAPIADLNNAGVLGVSTPPPRYFMLGITATTFPASAGTLGPVEMYYV